MANKERNHHHLLPEKLQPTDIFHSSKDSKQLACVVTLRLCKLLSLHDIGSLLVLKKNVMMSSIVCTVIVLEKQAVFSEPPGPRQGQGRAAI